MPLSDDKRIRIQEEVKRILLKRENNFPEDVASNRNAPFHAAFLDAFRERLGNVNIQLPYLVALASWMHGFNTSLGSGFENIAHILSGGYKRRYTKQFTLKVTANQATAINGIIVDLKARRRVPDVESENALIASAITDDEPLQDALEFTADNYVEQQRLIECIEMKSVRPNSGEGRGEKQKILYGKAALKRLHRDKEVKFYIGFPFDPTSPTPTGYDKNRFMNYLIEFKKFFSPSEVLIAGELWDHLSRDTNTMEQLLQIVSATVNEARSH
jgi:hypothetical protein